MGMTTSPHTEGISTMNINDELAAQPELAPGTEGWWQVWGARPCHIRPGDALAIQGEEGWLLVEDLFEAKAAPARQGLVANGERFTIGALCPIALLRRGTHNTLA